MSEGFTRGRSSRSICRRGPRAPGHGDEAIDPQRGRQPDGKAQVVAVALGDIRVRMQRVAGDVERGYAEAGMVENGLPLAELSGVANQLGCVAVRCT